MIRWSFFFLVLAAAGCGSGQAPVNPTPTSSSVPVKTLTAVQVGTAGNAPTSVAPGQTLQLFALANYSDGSTADVTYVAFWQSSNPVVATVSSGGVLAVAAEGAVDITATYQNVLGPLHFLSHKLGCEATSITPPSVTFGAFGGFSSEVSVVTLSDCLWTAQSDAAWLPFTFNPQRSGNGSFSYSVPGNSSPTPRTAHIVVTVAGAQIVHTITQQAPVSCSYVVTPDRVTLGTSGGSASFDVTTTPGDCRWTASTDWSQIRLTGAKSGTGAGRVTYTVSGFLYVGSQLSIQVAGLSGANPPGIHTIHIGS